MSLAQKIQHLFPSSVPLKDWTVTDDGTGPRVTEWKLPDTQPTQAQLDALTDADVLTSIETREDAKEPLLADLKAQAQIAIDANDVFLAITNPSAAQNAAQAKALTRQNNRIIKALARLTVRTWR